MTGHLHLHRHSIELMNTNRMLLHLQSQSSYRLQSNLLVSVKCGTESDIEPGPSTNNSSSYKISCNHTLDLSHVDSGNASCHTQHTKQQEPPASLIPG